MRHLQSKNIGRLILALILLQITLSHHFSPGEDQKRSSLKFLIKSFSVFQPQKKKWFQEETESCRFPTNFIFVPERKQIFISAGGGVVKKVSTLGGTNKGSISDKGDMGVARTQSTDYLTLTSATSSKFHDDLCNRK